MKPYGLPKKMTMKNCKSTCLNCHYCRNKKDTWAKKIARRESRKYIDRQLEEAEHSLRR